MSFFLPGHDPDINSLQDVLILAKKIKRVSAHFKINKPKDMLYSTLTQLLDKEAKELEEETLQKLYNKNANPSPR